MNAMIQDPRNGELLELTADVVFSRRADVVDSPGGRWKLAGQDVTEQVDRLISYNWVRVQHFCGGSRLRARPCADRVRFTEMSRAS